MSTQSLFRGFRRRQVLSLTGLAASALLLFARDSVSGTLPAPPAAACSVGSLTVGDTLINPPTGGDNDFFSIPPGPPNIMFLLGNNDSMQDFVTPLPDAPATGCTDPSLTSPATNPIINAYDPSSSDPKKNGLQAYDPDPDFSSSLPQFFDPTKFYVSYSNRLPLSGVDAIWSMDNSFRATQGDTLAVNACARYGLTPADAAVCQTCLTSAGWYAYTPGGNGKKRWILSGRVLNVLPPKFVVSRKVVKDVLSGVNNVRLGVAIYGQDPKNQYFYDPPVIIHPVKPSCDKSYPVLDQSELAAARNDIVKQVNMITFTNNERSIGEALLGLGAYFSSQKVDGKWSNWFDNLSGVPAGYPGAGSWTDGPTTWTQNVTWEAGGNQKSVCWPCQSTAVVVLSDGVPQFDNSVPASKMLQTLVAQGARHPDGSLVAFNPGTATPGGVNYCDKFGGSKLGCDQIGGAPQGPDATNKNFMDDVAFFLSHMDLRDDYNGNEGINAGQRVRTYTIGFGDNSPMLKSIASAGLGRFYTANNGDQLRDVILRAINDIKQTATSFSSANLTPVQTGGQQFSAYVPRFIPFNDRPYEGHLYRYQYFSEFVEGCDPKKASSPTGDPADLDKDGKCDGVFLLDAPAGFILTPGNVPPTTAYTSQTGVNQNIVQENKDGVWVKVNTATVDPSTGKLNGGQPAQPFWDAADALNSRTANAPCPGPGLVTSGGRCIFTMIDRNGDGRFDDRDNPPVEFIQANEPILRPYLLAGGDSLCVDVFTRLNLTYTGSQADQIKCTQTVIDFVRGVDVFDVDADGNTTENLPCANDNTKSCMLGDLFHSSPILVDPPVDPFICDIGLHNQCVRTLYMDYTAYGNPPAGEPTCGAGSPKPCYQATKMNPPLNLGTHDYGAYGQYLATYQTRDRFLLVGANDGMLHAFHAGSVIPLKQKQSPLDDVYDLGTGQEMWAFIPPDLLPKLGMMARGHQYMVDGTPMVRDIWKDGSGNSGNPGEKEWSEFHTVAIVSERGGGTRYVALDVTDPWAMTKGAQGAKPFRWMWPNANDPESAEVGQSWENFAPKPPPIGPVRLENTTNARGWDERWIVMLNGGYSADLTRGRGVYMLDAWTGQKIWSFSAKPSGSPTGNVYVDQVQNRMMPVAAAVALLDVGKAASLKHDTDGFFDTAVVGDLAGQMWTFRFYTPGHFTSGVVSNWYGARSLEMNREDLSATSPRNLALKEPFFSVASNTLQPDTGWVRTFAGTGDRQNLRDQEATGCSPSNLLACTRLKCNADIQVGTNVNGQFTTSRITINAGQLVTNTTSTGGSMATGNTCGGAKLGIDTLNLSCPSTTSLATNPWTLTPTLTTQSQCTNSGGSYSCTVAGMDMDAKGNLQPNTSGMPKNRFFGFETLNGTDRMFTDEASAVAYDSKRVTDKPFSCTATNGCALKDVTIPASARQTVTSGGQTYQVLSPNYNFPKAGASDPGWFLAYDNLDEKTGAGSSVLGGIVFWPSFLVQVNNSGPCTSNNGDLSRSWQADIITGAPDQAESFKVYDSSGQNLLGYQQNKTRAASSPPPEPANVISLSKTGQVRYGISVIEPGSKPSNETLRSKTDITSDIYWLEVPRSVHQCRHVDNRACQ